MERNLQNSGVEILSECVGLMHIDMRININEYQYIIITSLLKRLDLYSL